MNKINAKTKKNTVSKDSGRKMDMLHGPLAKNLLLFSIPIAASTILEQLFNSADVAVAGHFAGSDALAAVGANSPVINLFIYILTGLALGANVLIARLIGEGKQEQISKVVHTAITFSFFSGLFMMVFGICVSKPLLSLMGTPSNILEQAQLYLRIYCLALPFLMFYNFGSAVLRSIGDTKRPLYILIAAGCLNIVLNLFFVIVIHMGVAGVATATVLSNVLCAFLMLRILLHESYPFQLHFNKMRLDKRVLSTIVKIGAPAALQSSLFSFSNIIVQTAINSLGSDAVAGSSTGLNFEYFTYYIIAAFSQAIVTFTSQNYGAGNPARCKKVLRLGMLEGMGLTALMSTLIMLTLNYTVLFYTSDQNVISYAVIRVSQVAAFEACTGLYELTGAAIRGLGRSLLPALLSIMGTVVFRFFWIQTIFAASRSYSTLMWLYLASWLLTGSLMITAYFITRKSVYKHMNAPA